MDAVQQQNHRPLKPMMDPHQHQDQNQNQHPPGVPWYPGQFQYQTSGAPPQQWVPSHHHNPSMDQSMQGQQQQQQQYAPGHGFNPIHDMYTQHQGQQHYPPPPQRPMPPHQVTHMYAQPDQVTKPVAKTENYDMEEGTTECSFPFLFEKNGTATEEEETESKRQGSTD